MLPWLVRRERERTVNSVTKYKQLPSGDWAEEVVVNQLMRWTGQSGLPTQTSHTLTPDSRMVDWKWPPDWLAICSLVLSHLNQNWSIVLVTVLIATTREPHST